MEPCTVVISGFFELVGVFLAKKQCRVKGGEGLSNFKHNLKTMIDEQEGKWFLFPISKVDFNLYTQLFPFL
jgi:hypothetical protein